MARRPTVLRVLLFQKNLRTLRTHCMSRDIMSSERLAVVRAAYGLPDREDSVASRDELAAFLLAGASGKGGGRWRRDRVERHAAKLERRNMLQRATGAAGTSA